MQQLRDKLAIAERTAKTESQLKVGYQCAKYGRQEAFVYHLCYCRFFCTYIYIHGWELMKSVWSNGS
jgi:hypothetical protein